ncbi:metal ABC transporter permease [Actinobaculum suis]|uniref:metal ABC transporter permease n=1 Tax=Actinobaculum suis TaxID=1657 RepID=UPI00080868A1|nr:metal ABC transporter permease [Actinobaculum suis]OCA94708.1 hypothetical protein ACU21_05810 [Actinobaculum suis]OCA95403.1 hypothetical protein ACU20_04100 [Actinobaculum suis]
MDFSFIPISEFLGTYGFRTTFLAALLVGLLAGAFGSLLYLRRQSLLSDVMGHSAIFGVVGAFVFATAVLGINGQSMTVLVIGAAISGFLSVAFTHWITARTTIAPDTAMAVSLALFYGGGMCGLHMVNHSSLPNRSGLSNYIFGNAATTRASDLSTIFWFGVAILIVLVVFWKEFKVSIFDPLTAQSYGYRPAIVNGLLMTCITIAIVTGVKSVGMILMVAFAILPATVMHQFARSMSQMVLGSGLLGAAAGGIGAYLSICAGKVPTGPVVVLLLFLMFVVGLVLSPRRRGRKLSGDMQEMRELDAPEPEVPAPDAQKLDAPGVATQGAGAQGAAAQKLDAPEAGAQGVTVS